MSAGTITLSIQIFSAGFKFRPECVDKDRFPGCFDVGSHKFCLLPSASDTPRAPPWFAILKPGLSRTWPAALTRSATPFATSRSTTSGIAPSRTPTRIALPTRTLGRACRAMRHPPLLLFAVVYGNFRCAHCSNGRGIKIKRSQEDVL